jgi:hypothetical protein
LLSKQHIPRSHEQNIAEFATRLQRLSDTFPANSEQCLYLQQTPEQCENFAQWWHSKLWENNVKNGNGEDAYQKEMNECMQTLEMWTKDPTKGLILFSTWLRTIIAPDYSPVGTYEHPAKTNIAQDAAEAAAYSTEVNKLCTTLAIASLAPTEQPIAEENGTSVSNAALQAILATLAAPQSTAVTDAESVDTTSGFPSTPVNSSQSTDHASYTEARTKRTEWAQHGLLTDILNLDRMLQASGSHSSFLLTGPHAWKYVALEVIKINLKAQDDVDMFRRLVNAEREPLQYWLAQKDYAQWCVYLCDRMGWPQHILDAAATDIASLQQLVEVDKFKDDIAMRDETLVESFADDAEMLESKPELVEIDMGMSIREGGSYANRNDSMLSLTSTPTKNDESSVAHSMTSPVASENMHALEFPSRQPAPACIAPEPVLPRSQTVIAVSPLNPRDADLANITTPPPTPSSSPLATLERFCEINADRLKLTDEQYASNAKPENETEEATNDEPPARETADDAEVAEDSCEWEVIYVQPETTVKVSAGPGVQSDQSSTTAKTSDGFPCAPFTPRQLAFIEQMLETKVTKVKDSQKRDMNKVAECLDMMASTQQSLEKAIVDLSRKIEESQIADLGHAGSDKERQHSLDTAADTNELLAGLKDGQEQLTARLKEVEIQIQPWQSETPIETARATEHRSPQLEQSRFDLRIRRLLATTIPRNARHVRITPLADGILRLRRSKAIHFSYKFELDTHCQLSHILLHAGVVHADREEQAWMLKNLMIFHAQYTRVTAELPEVAVLGDCSLKQAFGVFVKDIDSVLFQDGNWTDAAKVLHFHGGMQVFSTLMQCVQEISALFDKLDEVRSEYASAMEGHRAKITALRKTTP